jgi:hypothetical protein
MAVGNNSNAAFFSIYNGKICKQFQSKTDNSQERVNKNGKLVHEEFYDYHRRHLLSISTIKRPR